MYGHDVVLTLYQFNTSFNTNGYIYIYPLSTHHMHNETNWGRSDEIIHI
jgi:hypothetical protein